MELQLFINENPDYVDIFKKRGLKVMKYTAKDLILVKNFRDKPLKFKDESDYWIMYCRGVVIDTLNDKVICLPPVKSIIRESADLTFHGGEIQFLIDGTMINLFYREEWILSTRSEIGGRNKWINNKSFKEMFFECSELELDSLDKNCSYSFVMRHKDNRNVSPIIKNEIVLVEMYRYSDTIERLHSGEYPDTSKIKNESLISLEKLDSLWSIGGYLIKEGSKRYKVENPGFERVKSLKINVNNELLNYIELRQNGNLIEYLKYFPEKSKLFERYRNKIHKLSNELYNSYKNLYILKKIKKKDIPYYLKPLVTDIHKKYLSSNEKTTWIVIKTYIHCIPSKKLAYAINYVI